MDPNRSLVLGIALACSVPACSSNGGGPSVTGGDASLGDTGSGSSGPGDATTGGDAGPGDSAAPTDGGADAPSTGPTDAGALDAACALGDAALGTCTDTDPQVDDAGAANLTTLKYLAQAGIVSAGLITDNWDPTAGVGDVTTFDPGTFTVGATGATYTTVQAAIDAAVTQGGTQRIYIRVAAGTYREVVCVPGNAPPITLYSTNADASQTVIVYNNYNGEALDAGAINACARPSSTATTYGTAGSATFISLAKGFQAKNITFSNDVSNTTLSATTGTQAVALMTEADQIVLENIRALGHQDTLYIETTGTGTVLRAYVKSSYIAGDVDFIFGGATFVLDGCQINFAADRRGTGDILSPSTDTRNPYGILVTNSTFTADPGTAVGAVTLGRAWDRSTVDIPTYVSEFVAACDFPNGQALVRESVFAPAINATSPWSAAATSKRPFCSEPWVCTDAGAGVCPANRLYEFHNTATDGGAL